MIFLSVKYKVWALNLYFPVCTAKSSPCADKTFLLYLAKHLFLQEEDAAYIKNILIARQLSALNTSLGMYWKTTWEEMYVHASYPKTL